MEKKKILVVDDDPEVSDLVTMTLMRDGYSVVRAVNGAQGLEKAIAENPVLVITDVQMPIMDGLTLCSNLRKHKDLRLVPIIMLTGSKIDPQERIAGLKIGADDYILKPFLPDELSIRVSRLITRTQENISVNPLTRLPGSYTLEEEVNKRIAGGNPFAACYIDINHFKAANDHYGYKWGDEVIKLTAEIIKLSVTNLGAGNDLVVHIGGDDFIALTLPEKVDVVCEHVIREFERSVSRLYDPVDRDRGYLTVLNRRGKTENFNLLSLSVAVSTNERRKIDSYLQMADILKELKTFAKTKIGSFIAKDRRTF